MAKRETEWDDWSQVDDILHPINEEKATAPPPRGNTPDTEREWQKKRAQEDLNTRRAQRERDRQFTSTKQKRLAWPKGRLQKQRQQKQRPLAAAPAAEAVAQAAEAAEVTAQTAEAAVPATETAAKTAWLPAAAQVVPYAVMLLLAPLIKGEAGFYLLVLVTAAPVALAAILLRPLGRWAWLLRAVAPLLPLEAWFALRYFLWNLGGALALAGLCALAGLLYYGFAVRGKARGGDKSRGVLLFVTLLAAVTLLVPAALGVGLQLYRASPNERDDFAAQSLEDDELMTRRMNGAYELLQPEQWALMGREKKLEALQALLDVETDDLGLPRFDLRDPMVFTAVSGSGHTSVPAALFSVNTRAEQRVRAMCHLAYHLKQLTISENVNMRWFEEEAAGRENNRYAAYANRWENREAEIDHVQ